MLRILVAIKRAVDPYAVIRLKPCGTVTTIAFLSFLNKKLARVDMTFLAPRASRRRG